MLKCYFMALPISDVHYTESIVPLNIYPCCFFILHYMCCSTITPPLFVYTSCAHMHTEYIHFTVPRKGCIIY